MPAIIVTVRFQIRNSLIKKELLVKLLKIISCSGARTVSPGTEGELSFIASVQQFQKFAETVIETLNKTEEVGNFSVETGPV